MSRETKKTDRFIVKKSSAGLGLFAGSIFHKGDFLIEYTGKILNNDQANAKGGRYLFHINSKMTLDGSDRKNLGRYINHSCSPNCEPRIKKRKILIYAIKKIIPGEEITYNYGKEYFNEFIKPKGCKCKKCLR